ncbi:MAG: protein translocase subunit SecDF [Aureispira sp.]|nr:protein translocase subunit SecDF [Aureispira sp.]
MQGKGLIKFFTFIMLAVVAYQFMLWFPTKGVESSAEAYANAAAANISDPNDHQVAFDRARQKYLDSISEEVVFSIPLVKDYTYQELQRQQLAWGLDLQGGMSVVLQVELSDLIHALSGKSSDSGLQTALAKAKAAQKNTQSDFVTLFGEEYAKLNTGKRLATIFTISNKLKDIGLNSTDEEVLSAIRVEASATVKNTYQLLKKRIDKFGVAQPIVSLDPSTDRITVELPGVRNPKRARKYLQATANLEFWELYQNNEILSALDRLNTVLKKKYAKETPKPEQDTTNTPIVPETPEGDSTETDTTGNDFQQIGDTPIDSLEDEDYGPLFNLMSPYTGEATATIGVVDVNKADTLVSLLNSKDAKKVLPKSVRFALDAKPFKGQDGNRYFVVYALNTKGKAESSLQGERIVSAFPTSNQGGRGYAVSLSMDNIGAQEWKKMTQRNVNKQVAVVLDDRVYSAPVVNEVIPNGNTQISGNFSVTEATDLANILSIGKLPVEAEIIEEAIVGPSLGAATVYAGLLSLFIGFILVLAFMLGYYSFAGLIAVLALFLNVFFIIGTLASLGTVLTLPGIAGIVLTIGMAVDANVIIFERIREELRGGVDWKEAIIQGFKHSYSAIVDANVTTLLTAAVLFQYGLGPIKGFATVLIVGVLCSLFAAVLVGRLLFDYWAGKGKEISVWSGWSKNVFANTKIDFVSKRKIAYMVSGVILVASLASMFTRGFELGVDLKGGRSYTVVFAQDVDVDKFKTDLVASFKTLGEDVESADKTIIKTFNEGNQVKVTTSFLQESEKWEPKELDSLVMLKLYEGAQKYSGGETTYDQFEAGEPNEKNTTANDFYVSASSKVGPTIADDIRQSAFLASILSLLLIFGYIFFRFRKWQFSLGAVAALLHDVIFVLGMFSIFKGLLPFSLEIDQAFIAAILTVIGYSINDTVVVFDRIRETATNMENEPIKKVVNIAVNNTISRTVITSLTTFFVIFILFVFGGDGIRGFAFALLVGVLVGTYSSVFIATPVVVDTTKDLDSIKYEKEEVVEEETTEEGDENPEA